MHRVGPLCFQQCTYDFAARSNTMISASSKGFPSASRSAATVKQVQDHCRAGPDLASGALFPRDPARVPPYTHCDGML